jgi:hypothetical protein
MGNSLVMLFLNGLVGRNLLSRERVLLGGGMIEKP